MNCRINSLRNLGTSDRKMLYKAVSKYNETILKEEMEKMKIAITNNILKLFVIASNKECGIGKDRMEKILRNVREMIGEMTCDAESFYLIAEKECRQILGEEMYNSYFKDIPFKPMPENFNFIENELK